MPALFALPLIYAVAASIAISIAVSVGLSLLTSLLRPRPSTPQFQQQQAQQSAVPKPADGKYNLRQNVPSLCVIYGRVKKGGDYVFLEETQGTAFHVLVSAAHKIEGYVSHYLHDEPITRGPTNWITAPAHFGGHVRISVRTGFDIQEAWSAIVGFFPTIWTADHRGDGLAQVVMEVQTVAQEDFGNVYPQQMPVHTAIIDGAWVYDPRDDDQDPDDHTTWLFSTNLALIRLDHLTKPFGGKLSLSDMYLADWSHAADVCDETVTTVDEFEESRYHGGLWFRYENDPVEIGRTIDEAAELVLYERADGLIGVHAGEMVTPDIRVTADEITRCTYDANRRASTNVLAVRGRWTDPGSVYNTVDAAIYGDPYISSDDTQRTKTVDNSAVQTHNHMQRLQKLAFTRANAPRVSITVHYKAGTTGNITYRRFVTVHYPSRGLDEAVVEIIGRPKLSLANLTLTFDGIVVPSTLYDFDAATEEGVYTGAAGSVAGSGVPVPTNFTITIAEETVPAGTSIYAVGSWDFVSDALTYDFEYQLADQTQPARSVRTASGVASARTEGSLVSGANYRFRVRTRSSTTAGAWTAYTTVAATVPSPPMDPTPSDPTGLVAPFSGIYAADTPGWTNGASNIYRTELYRSDTSSFGGAVLIFTSYLGPSAGNFYADVFNAVEGYYWVRSYNSVGTASNLVGPVQGEAFPVGGGGGGK